MEDNPSQLLRAVAPSVRMLVAPVSGAELDTHVLLGEDVEFLEEAEDPIYYRVRALLDGKEGYVQRDMFEPVSVPGPSFRVIVPRAVVFRKPDFKGPVKTHLAMNALVTITDVHKSESDTYVRISGFLGNEDGWMYPSQLARIDDFDGDIIKTLMMFVGPTPYVWGSRDANIGVDCSAIIQAALIRHGYKNVPRDSGPMSENLGVLTYENPLAYPHKPMELVFWERHVAMMINETDCVHATNAYHTVLVQPIREVMEQKLERGEGSITRIRQLEPRN